MILLESFGPFYNIELYSANAYVNALITLQISITQQHVRLNLLNLVKCKMRGRYMNAFFMKNLAPDAGRVAFRF